MKKLAVLFAVIYVFVIYQQRPTLHKEIAEDIKTELMPSTDYDLPVVKKAPIQNSKSPASIRPVNEAFIKVSKKVAGLFPKELETKVEILNKITINYQGKSVPAYKALIEHKNIEGKESSYHAFISEETGQIMMTDRPQTETSPASLRYKGAI